SECKRRGPGACRARPGQLTDSGSVSSDVGGTKPLSASGSFCSTGMAARSVRYFFSPAADALASGDSASVAAGAGAGAGASPPPPPQPASSATDDTRLITMCILFMATPSLRAGQRRVQVREGGQQRHHRLVDGVVQLERRGAQRHV